MKNRFFLFSILFPCFITAQITIKGSVFASNLPLENVAVYLNNTMLGTTTNKAGEFTLTVTKGEYELIVSYLGFKKINYNLNTSTYQKPLRFNLVEEENVLNEITIKKTVYDETWKHNLASFKQEFIGLTNLAQECEILNPEVLHFEFDYKQNKFTAFARKPLKIKNKGLGYLITYELEDFTKINNYVSYLGYSRYENLKGGKRKKKRWKANREIAYKGSVVHFLKSLINDTFKEEGYIVNQFKRVLNTKRPSDEAIEKARTIIRFNRINNINIKRDLENPKNAIDSAYVTVRKSRLPKYEDYLYKSQLKKEDIISIKNNQYYLIFENNLSIVYSKEKEELRFLRRTLFSKRTQPLAQTSSFIPVKKNVIIDKRGILKEPLSAYYEGYWSYEKFANSLPLDYKPDYGKD